MSVFLGYLYSLNLTEQEEKEVNARTQKSREEFSKGFRKGSFLLVSFYLLTSALSASAGDVPAPAPKTPGDNGGVQPKTPPTSKPGFQPLSETTKGAFVGGATAICGAALQSGDFYLGFACAVLLVIGGILINRPPH